MDNSLRFARVGRLGGVLIAASIGLASLACFNIVLSARGAESLMIWICAALTILPGVALVALISAIGSRSHVLFSTVLLAMIVSVPTTNWPLRVTFWLSQAALAQLANELDDGEGISFPCNAGLFRVEMGEIKQGCTCLWLDPHPGGPRGFVRCTPQEPPLNLWSTISLGNNWHLVAED
jgi:hypothetical protein